MNTNATATPAHTKFAETLATWATRLQVQIPTAQQRAQMTPDQQHQEFTRCLREVQTGLLQIALNNATPEGDHELGAEATQALQTLTA